MIRRAALIVAFLLLAGLPVGAALHDSAAARGHLEIRLKDHREAIGDFSALRLKIGKIAVSRKPGLAFWRINWTEFSPALAIVDLTRYTGKESVVIYRGMIDAGAFDAIQLKIDGIDAVLNKTQRSVAVRNTLTPIKVTFSVTAKGNTVIILDLVVVDMSDHPPRAYELGIKGYEISVNGKLTEKVPPA
jgi:hypothetical protein